VAEPKPRRGSGRPSLALQGSPVLL